MKKTTIALILILAGLGGYFYMKGEVDPGAVMAFLSEDRKTIESIANSFMEDIQYKDFDKAATYHSPDDQKTQDIPYLIERVFQIKPELLDIMEYEITEVTLDSSKSRGRTKVLSKVHRLNTDDFRDVELMLYFSKQGEKWYMELESSLRKPKKKKQG